MDCSDILIFVIDVILSRVVLLVVKQGVVERKVVGSEHWEGHEDGADQELIVAEVDSSVDEHNDAAVVKDQIHNVDEAKKPHLQGHRFDSERGVESGDVDGEQIDQEDEENNDLDPDGCVGDHQSNKDGQVLEGVAPRENSHE